MRQPKHLRVPAPLTLLLCVPLACTEPGASDDGADTETGTSEDTGTDTDTDTDTDTGSEFTPCPCVPPTKAEEKMGPPPIPTCEAMLCSAINVNDGEVEDPEAVDCALEALRDRTPGLLRWGESDLFEMSNDYGYLLILPDGRVITRSWGGGPANDSVSPARIGELWPAADFEACLVEADPYLRFDCVLTARETALQNCDSGWAY